jgi:hypothetical protein
MRPGRFVTAGTLFACLAALILLPPAAAAQLATQHLKGTFGLKGGSQAPPGGYVVAPLLYVYDTDTVRGREGNTLPINANLTSALFGAGYSHVTTKKVLGGLYGYTVLLVGANNRIQGTEIDSDPGAGITDSVVTPLWLGWHFERGDAQVQYTLYVPTGRYTDGAANNTGLGMWGHEVALGGTTYLTASRQYHAATTVSFNVQSKKEDSETKVGNAMNLEGGIGGDFLKGGLTVGLSYYWSLKLTNDQIERVPPNLQPDKNRTFGLGPEVTLALARKNTVYGFLGAKYFWETYARSGTQGTGFFLTATFLTTPLKIQAP